MSILAIDKAVPAPMDVRVGNKLVLWRPPHVGARVRLLKDVPELDLQRGALGKIVDVFVGDDIDYKLQFDARPGMRCGFWDYEFDPRCPNYTLEVLT